MGDWLASSIYIVVLYTSILIAHILCPANITFEVPLEWISMHPYLSFRVLFAYTTGTQNLYSSALF